MFGPKELVVVLVVLLIVLVVFGPKRIKSLGSELGNAIKGFRQAVKERDEKDAAAEAMAQEAATGQTDEPGQVAQAAQAEQASRARQGDAPRHA
jgi:sec-independent protein translocase protein TatA